MARLPFIPVSSVSRSSEDVPDDQQTAPEPPCAGSQALLPVVVKVILGRAVQTGRPAVRPSSPTPAWSSPLPNHSTAAVAQGLCVCMLFPLAISRKGLLGFCTTLPKHYH